MKDIAIKMVILYDRSGKERPTFRYTFSIGEWHSNNTYATEEEAKAKAESIDYI